MRGLIVAAMAACFAGSPVFAAGAAPAPAATPAAAAKPAAAAAARRDELWFIVRANDGALAYDAKSIKMNAELSTVEIASLLYFKAGMRTTTGHTFHFVKGSDTLDCVGTQFKPGPRQIMDADAKPLGTTEPPPKAAWLPIVQNPPLSALRGVACGGGTFKNMVQAPTMAAAVKAMKEMK